MASLLKILTDTSCDVYVDYEYRGHAEPYKLLRLELRKGCYILEFKYKDMILESQDYVMPSNDEETLLKLSLADKYAAAQEAKRTLFYTATEKLNIDRLCLGSNIVTHIFNETEGRGSIIFYKSIIEIAEETFYNCSSLTSITIPESVISIGEAAFFGCTSLISIAIPDSVTSIGAWTFCKCTSLTSITIPESVTSIGAWTFNDCTSLESITIPESVTEIGERVFCGCSALVSITIHDSVTSIGEAAFCNCTSLKSIAIPKSVTSIGAWALNGCTSLMSFYGKYASKDNKCLIVDNTLVAFARAANITSYTIPESITGIGEGAFAGCHSLISITIPESVNLIGVSAFYRCTSLSSFYGKYASKDNRCLIVDNALVAFAAANLTLYTIPESVTEIGERVFYNCTSLTSITIPNSVTKIGKAAFYGCTSLISITIPESVTLIELEAFAGCTSLISITIPESVTSIGAWAFHNCTSLKSMTIPKNITKIGIGTFYGCASLKSVTIPESVTSIGARTFHNCTSLTSITIPNSVTKIGEAAFYGCTSLKSVTIPESVTEIGAWALYVGATIQEGFGSANSAFERCNVNYVRYTRDYEVRGKYLFFDTETTGLPINYNAPTSDLSNWPRMVQLSWILTDNEGMTISYGNFIVKPSGFTISGPAIKLHGITNEIANKDGVALKEVLAKFMEDVKNSSCLVGHNVEFDKHIVGAEFLRMGDKDIISFMTSICTMMSSIDYCKIINRYGYKYPKLQELYKKLFDESFEDAHDALADVRATYRCFFELKRKNIINESL